VSADTAWIRGVGHGLEVSYGPMFAGEASVPADVGRFIEDADADLRRLAAARRMSVLPASLLAALIIVPALWLGDRTVWPALATLPLFSGLLWYAAWAHWFTVAVFMMPLPRRLRPTDPQVIAAGLRMLRTHAGAGDEALRFWTHVAHDYPYLWCVAAGTSAVSRDVTRQVRRARGAASTDSSHA